MKTKKTIKQLAKSGWINAEKTKPNNDKNVIVIAGIYFGKKIVELVELIGFYKDGQWKSTTGILKGDDVKVLFWFPYPSIN